MIVIAWIIFCGLITVHHNFLLTTSVSAVCRILLRSDSEWSLQQQDLTKKNNKTDPHKKFLMDKKSNIYIKFCTTQRPYCIDIRISAI